MILDSAYQLLLECEHWSYLQWALKNGKPLNGRNLKFLVESNRPDSISTDEFLEQTGMEWRKGIGKPGFIFNANGWTIKKL